ncbi:hypothetical protein FQR65_LT02234 [Abscondita terminalis]|nr:hypothetical protein FQR65_LT02234 [Abscondita terminalis]
MMENDCDLQSHCSDSCMEKENHSQTVSPMKHESDLSMYNSSPKPLTCSMHPIRPLEDHDSNSQDSGYGPGWPSERNKFYEFAQSLGVTPRVDCSSMKTCSSSFESMGYMDDEFLELADLEHPINDNYQLPSDFNSLLNGSFIGLRSRDISPQYGDNQRMRIRRAISYDVTGHTPNSSRVRSCLFKKDEVDFHSIKRRDRSEELISPIQNKRSRIEMVPLPDLVVPQRPVFGRSMSATEESIKFAVHRSSTEPDLIGDFSKAFCLPLISGKHPDLKSITASTLALLLRGKYRGLVNSYKVIDCRYPYEYNGGHIEGAINLYTKEQILERLLDIEVTLEEHMEKSSRNILVFHCEFSSERGPNLYRFLRKWDRFRNTDVYPALHYPEVYLLEGGYKRFYEQFSGMCVPEAYLPMLHPGHSKDLKLFRAKSKSWNEDRYKGSLKRLDRV